MSLIVGSGRFQNLAGGFRFMREIGMCWRVSGRRSAHAGDSRLKPESWQVFARPRTESKLTLHQDRCYFTKMAQENQEKRFETIAAGDQWRPAHEPLLINVPIIASSSFRLSSVESAERIVSGKEDGYFYSRWANPTCDAAGELLNRLEGGEGTLVFSSGMAAISTALMAMLKTGDHVVAPKMVYSAVKYLLGTIFNKFGIEVTWVDGFDVKQYRDAVKENTKILFGETPCNPDMAILDMEEFGKLGKSLPGVITMVDSTIASPFNLQPIKFGIDVVVHSCTKFLGGHNDLIAGSLTSASKELHQTFYEMHKFLGAAMSPFDGYLLHRGIKTLHVRMERHNSNAMEMAKFLENHPKVRRVHYPGLPSDPNHAVAKQQMKGFSGMLSFEVNGGKAEAVKVVEAVKVIQLAVSLGGTISLVELPAAMTHPEKCMLTSEQESGLSEALIRFSVGLEHIDDLKKDMDQALWQI